MTTPAAALIRRRAVHLLKVLPELDHDGAIDDVVDRATEKGLRPHSLTMATLDAYLIGLLSVGALTAGAVALKDLDADRYLAAVAATR